MFSSIAILTTWALATAVAASASDSDQKAAEQIAAPVYLAYRDALVFDASLPPATSSKVKLERLEAVDQAGRTALSKISFDKLPPSQIAILKQSIWAEIAAHDMADIEELKKMMPATGWFKISDVGPDAARAAFYIVQHSQDITLQQNVLARMRPLLKTSDVEGQFYGLLYDRVQIERGEMQVYGTQTFCHGGIYRPDKLLDPSTVNERRKELGFKQSEEDYLKMFNDEPCHEG